MPALAIAIVLVSTFMHAGWNLLVRSERGTGVFWRGLLISSVVGLGPAIAAEARGEPILPAVWHYLLAAGFSQGLYYLGLALGYRSGEFTVVYPLARALPVLLIAVADAALGKPPSWLGWLGILLVTAGCLLVPLQSVREITPARYWNRTVLWAAMTALATVGYTLADSGAARVMPPGLWTALRYGAFEIFLSLVSYWLLLRAIRSPAADRQSSVSWLKSAALAVLIFAAYGLVLWAYQLSAHTSYIVALRQFSIVLGVAGGGLIFREPAPGLRLSAAAIIALGCTAIGLAR